MHNFVFQNPTKLLFGKGMIAKLAKEVPAEARVLLCFGGGSVKSNGVYEQVREALQGKYCVEFWGIEANPDVATLRRAIDLGKQEQVSFVLAVGGGSVIDGCKLVAAGLLYEGDAWDLVINPKLITQTLPLASVLTLPATGSEMNSGAVISRRETQEKQVFYSKHPVFSILDPEVCYTLPKYQIACGLADTFVHTMEQYLTVTGESALMDRWAEGILHTLFEISTPLLQNTTNYDLLAEFMLSATMGLNGFIAMGVSQDWSTHMIGHELTALHGLTHGHTLAIVFPGTLRVLHEQKKDKLLQFGQRVLAVQEGTEEERVEATIEGIEAFFRSLGLSTRLSEENIGQATIDEIATRFTQRGVAYGERQNVDGEMARKILLIQLN